MQNFNYAEKVQAFISTLEWEICPANVRDVTEVLKWEALRMGPTKRKGAQRALNNACQLAHVSLPTWAL